MDNKEKGSIPAKNRDIDRLINSIKKKPKKKTSIKIAGLQGLQTGLGQQFNEKK